MSNPRYGATATYLPAIGKVLIVGGIAVGRLRQSIGGHRNV